MALTMTRNRTQTALTKLSELVANIHGELAWVEGLVAGMPEYAEVLAARRQKLQAYRDALYVTIKRFDPELAPSNIGTADQWRAPYGRRGSKLATQRYLMSLSI